MAEEKKDAKELDQPNKEGYTPLHLAAMAGNAVEVERLLKGGADPNKEDKHARTPLHLVILATQAMVLKPADYDGVVKCLLQYGADPNRHDWNGETPLYQAAFFKQLEIVKSLLNQSDESDKLVKSKQKENPFSRGAEEKNKLESKSEDFPESLDDAEPKGEIKKQLDGGSESKDEPRKEFKRIKADLNMPNIPPSALGLPISITPQGADCQSLEAPGIQVRCVKPEDQVGIVYSIRTDDGRQIEGQFVSVQSLGIKPEELTIEASKTKIKCKILSIALSRGEISGNEKPWMGAGDSSSILKALLEEESLDRALDSKLQCSDIQLLEDIKDLPSRLDSSLIYLVPSKHEGKDSKGQSPDFPMDAYCLRNGELIKHKNIGTLQEIGSLLDEPHKLRTQEMDDLIAEVTAVHRMICPNKRFPLPIRTKKETRWDNLRALCGYIDDPLLGPLFSAAATKNQTTLIEALLTKVEQKRGRDDFPKLMTELLHWTVRKGHLQTAEFLVEKGASMDPTGTAYAGMPPLLHWACEKGDAKLVKFLLSPQNLLAWPFDVNANAFCIASKKNHIEIVELLLKQEKKLGPENLWEAVEEAAEAGHIEMVRLLLAHGASISNKVGITVLHIASKMGHVALVEFLLEYPGILINQLGLRAHQTTALHLAARAGHTEVVKLLLRKGASPTIRDAAYQTALEVAASRKDNIPTLKHLFRVVVNREERERALCRAAEAGQIEMVQFLLDNKVSPCSEHHVSKTPLLLAAGRGHTHVVKCLLTCKMHPSFTYQALQVASRSGHIETVKLLLEHGVSVDGVSVKIFATPENFYGDTPLCMASKKGHLGVAKILLEHKAPINTLNGYSDQTALHAAAEAGHDPVVRFLLENKANPGQQNRQGDTPLQLAQRAGKNGVVQILSQAQASPLLLLSSEASMAVGDGQPVVSLLLEAQGAPSHAEAKAATPPQPLQPLQLPPNSVSEANTEANSGTRNDVKQAEAQQAGNVAKLGLFSGTNAQRNKGILGGEAAFWVLAEVAAIATTYALQDPMNECVLGTLSRGEAMMIGIVPLTLVCLALTALILKAQEPAEVYSSPRAGAALEVRT